jgi:VanZ family protein
MPKLPVQEPKFFHIPNLDKIVHFFLFFVWAIFLQKDLSLHAARKNVILFVLSMGLFIAVLTEYLQPIISNRTCDWQDGLADMVGITGGLLLPFKKKS